jgi:alkylation response protein AidB-like acyl-CoA dehydrogenase
MSVIGARAANPKSRARDRTPSLRQRWRGPACRIQTSLDPVVRARALGAEIAAAADEIERTRRIPEALLWRLHDSRLFRMLLPRAAGGDETEPAVYVAAIEELAEHDASIAWNAFAANSSALISAYLEPAVNYVVGAGEQRWRNFEAR